MSKKNYGKYHTAVGKYETHNIDTFEKVTINGVTLLNHNVCDGFIEEFNGCDCIYAEIAWFDGYSKFIEETSAQNTSYLDYLSGIKSVIEKMNVPTFILGGKKVHKILKAKNQKDISFVFHNNYKTCYSVYNVNIEDLDFNNEIEAREYISKKYNKILDFSCGYGIILKDILKQNKQAVLSDINNDCLNYIKTTLEEGGFNE